MGVTLVAECDEVPLSKGTDPQKKSQGFQIQEPLLSLYRV